MRTRPASRSIPRAWVWLLVALVAGCKTVGPDFADPGSPVPAGWESPSLAGVPKAPPAGPWWQGFRDPALDALIAAAIAANPDLRIAGLRVLEARALQAVARSGRSPQSVTAEAAGGYGLSAPGGVPLGRADFLFGSIGGGAAWELDLWGRFRRAIEGADAAYFASIANQQDFALILRAEVARLYLSHRTFEERLVAARANAALQRRSVEITGLLFRRGQESELDYQQALTQQLTTEATIPTLEAALVSTRNGLALLLGRTPGDLPELALSPSALPRVPDAVAADIPADILRLRPDVRAALFAAAAQSSRIGVATADLYPALVIGGSFSLLGTTLGGRTNSTDLTFGPAVRWNFLDFGRIRNSIRAEDARFEQALELYRRTVLQAASEVDSAAIQFLKAGEEEALLTSSIIAARRSLELAELRYREGLSDFQRVLSSQAAVQLQEDRLIVARGDRAAALVQLHKVLGGGLIAPAEADFASPETRERMRARTNWGTLLDLPPPEAAPAGATPPERPLP